MKLIKILLYFFCFVALVSCDLFKGSDDEDPTLIEGCTNLNSFNYSSEADTDDGSCIEMYGCLGYFGGYSNSGSLGVTLNDPYWDQKMNEEVIIQRNFFNGIPANVYVLYEPSVNHKNAYASPQGQIMFGYHMFYYTISVYGELPVAGILAHEWGHRTQFYHNWGYDEKHYQELEADAFSGFYMALAKQYAWANIESYFANVYANGDYNFNHPTHHGTPEQRLASAYLGVNTAIEILNSGKPLSYQELHSLFINEIETYINNEPQSNRFIEVKYPENLTNAYIESLFPYIE